MLKKICCLFIAFCLFLSGCSMPTEDVYKVVTELQWVEDPNYVPQDNTNVSSEESYDDSSYISSEESYYVPEYNTDVSSEESSNNLSNISSEESSKNTSNVSSGESSKVSSSVSSEETSKNPSNVSSEVTSNGSSNISSEESSEVPEEKVEPQIIHVKDYGAKADGKTDDGEAVMLAIFALGSAPEGSQLIFEKNKTYFVSNMMGITKFALYLSDLTNVSIKGDNTTILVDRDMSYMTMSGCTGVEVSGLNFDLKVRAHYVGTVEAVNVEEGYFDVVSDRDFGFYDTYTKPSGDFFGLKCQDGTSRDFIQTLKLETLDKDTLKYRVYADMDEPNLGTGGQVRKLKIGEKIILPVPEVGHAGQRMFSMSGNENIYFKDINVWNSREFVWGIWSSKGTITFDNVDVRPPKEGESDRPESVCFSSWRDTFHCKTNTAAIIWKNCTLEGSGDDIFNLSSNMMYVSRVISPNEVMCTWPETGGSYGSAEEGLPVIIWDADTGALVAKTKIKSVVNQSTNRYTFTDNIPNLKAGKNIRFCFDTHCAPNSKVINCYLDGTFRFHGGPVTVSDTKIRVIKVWIDNYTDIEGPIPHDVIFDKCDFAIANSAPFVITANSPVNKWKEGLYRLENVCFNNCTGLKKKYFSALNLREDSVDYVKFTPALTE